MYWHVTCIGMWACGKSVWQHVRLSFDPGSDPRPPYMIFSPMSPLPVSQLNSSMCSQSEAINSDLRGGEQRVFPDLHEFLLFLGGHDSYENTNEL